MNKGLKKFLIALGVLAVFIVVAVLMSHRRIGNFRKKYEGVDLTHEVVGTERTGTYEKYLNAHGADKMGTKDISVDITKADSLDGAKVVSNFEGADRALYTEAGSTATWTVNVPEAGFYNIYMEYFLPESKGVAAERRVIINDELPFNDAVSIEFSRIWVNDGPPRIDNQGNEIRPTQVEEYAGQSSCFKDDRGYEREPYVFWFEKGDNKLELYGVNEPMVIKTLELRAARKLISYEEYFYENSGKPSGTLAAKHYATVEGEDSVRRSESSLYAKYDRSSPTTSPNSVTTTVLNYVGGDAWRSNGMWVEWEFEVPEDG
jgi:hypothetical protein